jgi:deoxyribose-phosphate aldolase
MEPIPFESYIEHTLLKPAATTADIQELCREAIAHQFFGVCVNSSRVGLAYALLEETIVKVIGVVGFPLGAMDSDAKRFETESVRDLGAHEIDMVMNIGWMKEGAAEKILREIRDVVDAAEDLPVKVILETCYLTEAEKVLGCQLVVDSGAKFVKTSTGFGTSGATIADVKLLRNVVGENFGVKASGGIKNAKTFQEMISAGANRIGTSSGVEIIRELARQRPEDEASSH